MLVEIVTAIGSLTTTGLGILAYNKKPKLRLLPSTPIINEYTFSKELLPIAQQYYNTFIWAIAMTYRSYWDNCGSNKGNSSIKLNGDGNLNWILDNGSRQYVNGVEFPYLNTNDSCEKQAYNLFMRAAIYCDRIIMYEVIKRSGHYGEAYYTQAPSIILKDFSKLTVEQRMIVASCALKDCCIVCKINDLLRYCGQSVLSSYITPFKYLYDFVVSGKLDWSKFVDLGSTNTKISVDAYNLYVVNNLQRVKIYTGSGEKDLCV